jgi:phosphohistidine phosphatase SixA
MATGPALVQHLQQGGYVLLMRHAHAPAEAPDRAAADPANRKLERQLDDTGRNAARAMGDAIHKLRIPIGTVFSSPTYRALETVRLAGLARARTFEELGDGGQNMRMDAVAGEAAWLRNQIAQMPKAASNTVIVTQMPNIQSAFPQYAAHLSDGEALVFRPDGHGGAELAGDIKMDDWPGLAAK